MGKRLRVAVTISVEIDVDEWTETFGVEGLAAVRRDVKEYIGEGARWMGVFGNQEVTLSSYDYR